MDKKAVDAAAEILWTNWSQGSRIPGLPAHCRPGDRVQAYEIQAAIARRSSQEVVGWKIAATSAAGQAHIGVDGPLAGRLLSRRVLPAGSKVPLAGNQMRVAEVEFAFRLGSSLPKRDKEYELNEVLAAIETCHPAIEIPDSRYEDFARVGAPQLIADNACACWLLVGDAFEPDWRSRLLSEQPVTAYVNGVIKGQGRGANVLGDPLIALTWIANELRRFDTGLRAGELVTTGTCVVPVAIAPGDRVRGEFEGLGAIAAEAG